MTPGCAPYRGPGWRKFLLCCLWWLVAGHDYTGLGAVDWPTLGLTPVVTNVFRIPTGIAHAGDGSQRLFVVQKPGLISIIQNGAVLDRPFLDITNRVNSAGYEQGLLGLAFPPGFPARNYFYVDYTTSVSNAVVISRFNVSTNDPNVADTNSEQVILIIPKPFNNHNGGQLAFGPDGYLYIGVGDGGSEGDPQNYGQNTMSLLAKILRIDVESGVVPYAIPPSNPFANVPGYAPETWAWGLRNPWRFSFDRLTGDLYIGDVGQGSYEEIDFQPAGSPGGQNYGWRIMEGPVNYKVPAGFTNFSSLTLPVASYNHGILPTDSAGAVTGGYVYRGPSEPRMDGVYIYSDEISGWIWGLKREGTNWENFPLQSPGVGTPVMPTSTWGEDDLGQLYLADIARGKINRVYDTRYVWTPTFSPAKGTISSNFVVLSCASTNAEIHYTTNGVDPTLADPFVSSGAMIQVIGGATNKAKAFRSDLAPSSVASAVFTLQVGLPSFLPRAGAITNRTPVTISTVTPGATLYYTTNGATPTTNSALYAGPIIISGGTTLRALGVKAGYASSVASAVYSTVLAASPVFTPPAGVLTNATLVSISSTTAGADIRYTLNGDLPDTNSAQYVSPILLTQATTLRAIAFRDDLGPSPVQSGFYGFLFPDRNVVTTFAGSTTAGYSNAVGTLAQFFGPQAICFNRAGSMLVGDRSNHVIREVSLNGEVQTFAGSGVAAYQDGPAADAAFADPAGVCVDVVGNVVVNEGDCGTWRVRNVDANGMVTAPVIVQGVCQSIGQIEAGPDGNLYAAYGNSLRRITPNHSFVEIAAIGPGVAVDNLTNVYGAGGSQLWKITPDGAQTIIAGNAGSGFSDGPAAVALFSSLQDVVVDAVGNLYVSDQTRIRRLSPAGQVTTVAGTGVAGYANGPGTVARFANATGMCLDTNGNLYVTDTDNNCIRKISPDTAGIGIADDWQVSHFGHIGIDPNDDPDHDGMSNYAEFWAGTDPLNFNSALRITKFLLTPGAYPQVGWQTVPGKTYQLQYSTNLVSWTKLGETNGDGTINTFIDQSANSQQGGRYYRIVLTRF